MKFKMKPSSTFCFTFLFCYLFVGLSKAEGSFGDFEAAGVSKLSQDEIQKYYTEDTVGGRDMTQSECSAQVLERRKPYQQSVSTLDTSTGVTNRKIGMFSSKMSPKIKLS